MAERNEIININDIYLDLENPRIPYSIRNNEEGKSNEKVSEDILTYLIQTGSITELMLSIGQNGFFSGEALLLIDVLDENGDKTGKYIVIEGNRRATALKLLINPLLAKVSKNQIREAAELFENSPTNIPCIIYDSREELLKYLGYRHITGIKSWKALEKARHMDQVYKTIKNDNKSDDEVFKEIARSIGSRPSYIKRILESYKLYQYIESKDFFDIKGLDDTTFHFVNLSDSLNRSNLNKFLIENNDGEDFNKENLKYWTEWLFKENSEGETRLKGTSKDLGNLDIVVSKDEVLAAFIDKKLTLSQAVFYSEDAEDILSTSLEEALVHLIEADRVLDKVDDIEKVYDYNTNIKKIRVIAKKIFDYGVSQKENEY